MPHHQFTVRWMELRVKELATGFSAYLAALIKAPVYCTESIVSLPHHRGSRLCGGYDLHLLHTAKDATEEALHQGIGPSFFAACRKSSRSIP